MLTKAISGKEGYIAKEVEVVKDGYLAGNQ